MSRNQHQIKNESPRGQRCPCCGAPVNAAPAREPIRWYIADDGRTRAGVSALGAKLADALRANGQAVYVSPDGGKTLRRMGVVAAADGERRPTGEREPLILTPEEFQQYWRPARRGTGTGAPKAMAAGGAR